MSNLCPCGSTMTYDDCCRSIHLNSSSAATALDLMKARYSAYTQGNIDFIVSTTHPSKLAENNIEAMQAWADNAEWKGLEILASTKGQTNDSTGYIEFIARYHWDGQAHHHHEYSEFVNHEGHWYFYDAKVLHSGPSEKPTPVINTLKIGRNDPCHCGSGKKYKKCCGQ